MTDPRSLVSMLSNCYKAPASDDQTFRVIKWHYQAAYVGVRPNGHYINYFTFTYSPSDHNNPCSADATGGQVCDHDVVSDTHDGTCRYLANDEQITKIVIGKNKIRASGASMDDCTCP